MEQSTEELIHVLDQFEVITEQVLARTRTGMLFKHDVIVADVEIIEEEEIYE